MAIIRMNRSPLHSLYKDKYELVVAETLSVRDSEDTINTILQEKIKKPRFKAVAFSILRTPKGIRKPDLLCEDGGKYPIEAKFTERESISKVCVLGLLVYTYYLLPALLRIMPFQNHAKYRQQNPDIKSCCVSYTEAELDLERKIDAITKYQKSYTTQTTYATYISTIGNLLASDVQFQCCLVKYVRNRRKIELRTPS